MRRPVYKVEPRLGGGYQIVGHAPLSGLHPITDFHLAEAICRHLEVAYTLGTSEVRNAIKEALGL